MRKLGLHSKAALIKYAITNGLIDASEIGDITRFALAGELLGGIPGC